MIVGKMHFGSGLGDALFSYIATRTTAERLGVDFSFVGIENFKGKNFLILDWGQPNYFTYHTEFPSGKLIIDDEHKLFEINKPYFDPETQFIEDNTVIDGCLAQDERYWNIDKVRDWIGVKASFADVDESVCVINFRGGEFSVFPDLFLPQSYWNEAIEMKKAQGVANFEIHTDDKDLAAKFFPDFPIFTGIELNWRAVRFATHLILSNSAFGILPSLMNKNVKEIIAPRYHARRNIKQWSMPQNFYSKFHYI